MQLIYNIQFEGQTKTKLGNTEARAALESIVSEQLQNYFENIDNQQTLKLILDKAVNAAKVREAARKAKDITPRKQSGRRAFGRKAGQLHRQGS